MKEQKQAQENLSNIALNLPAKEFRSTKAFINVLKLEGVDYIK